MCRFLFYSVKCQHDYLRRPDQPSNTQVTFFKTVNHLIPSSCHNAFVCRVFSFSFLACLEEITNNHLPNCHSSLHCLTPLKQQTLTFPVQKLCNEGCYVNVTHGCLQSTKGTLKCHLHICLVKHHVLNYVNYL